MTQALLLQVAWWSSMRADVESWVSQCLTCIRFRKRPTKQDQVAVKPTQLNPWEEVMVLSLIHI